MSDLARREKSFFLSFMSDRTSELSGEARLDNLSGEARLDELFELSGEARLDNSDVRSDIKLRKRCFSGSGKIQEI